MARLEAADIELRKNPFKRNWLVTSGWVVLAGYMVFSFNAMGLSWERIRLGLGIAGKLMDRMFPPNFSRWELLSSGLAESMEIAIIASVVGIFLSLFFGLFAARNLMPNWVTVPLRCFLALCRTFHLVIIASLLVDSVDFGALAGILTFMLSSVVFLSRLFA